MPESLLSHSSVLIFGRIVEDLQITQPSSAAATDIAVATHNHKPTSGHTTNDGQALSNGDLVLILRGKNRGLYLVPASDSSAWAEQVVVEGTVYKVTGGLHTNEHWAAKINSAGKVKFQKTNPGSPVYRKGKNKQLEDQLIGEDTKFARIYAFSFEGAYYELPQPALFMVHGDGDEITPNDLPDEFASRSPTSPSITGLPAADFQFSDDMRYWSYDKADYTIRLDIESGMFEQVLLDLMLAGDNFGSGMAGATVRGATVRGATVRGATVRGATVRGATVRGATVRGGGGGD